MVATMTVRAKTDWKNVAVSLGVHIPEADLARTVAPLDGLEAAFRPLAAQLGPQHETSVIFTKSLEDGVE